MKFSKKILHSFGLVTKDDVKRFVSIAAQRGFDAAKRTRFQSQWKTERLEINQELKGDWPALNARVWNERMNSSIVAGATIDRRSTMIGPSGFDYQPMVKLPNGDPDEKTNLLLKEKFEEWCEEEYCTVTKRMSFTMVQYLISDYLFIEGAYIMRMHVVGETIKDNPFGFSLEFLDVADIDYKYNAELSDGTTVIMGIRHDKWRRIISVFFKDKTLYSELTGSYTNNYTRKEIMMDELLYGIDPMHHKITVGVTPWAPALIVLKNLGMWTGYAMENAKWSAAKMAFITTETQDADDYDGNEQLNNNNDTTGNGENENQEGEEVVIQEEISGKYMTLEGGTVEKLPFGNGIQTLDPKYPSDMHQEFIRSNGREIATATNRDYASMFGDREGESFSGGRQGEMKTNNTNAYEQTIFKEIFLKRVIKNWCRYSLLNRALDELEYKDYKKLVKHYWQGFFRGWIDPLKQANADEKNEQNGYVSKNQIITRNNGNMDDIFRDRLEYEKKKKKYGVDIENNKTGNQDNLKDNPDDKPDDNEEENVNDKTKNKSLKIVNNVG